MRQTVKRTRKSFIHTRFEKEGMHRFPRADKDPTFNTNDMYDVSHLASYHMHYFQFKVWVEVYHDDRDIEFIQLRRWLENLFNEGTLQADNKSCEMLASDVIEAIHNHFGNDRDVIVDVAEDGINGAVVEERVEPVDGV